jgi:hypothetical protein
VPIFNQVVVYDSVQVLFSGHVGEMVYLFRRKKEKKKKWLLFFFLTGAPVTVKWLVFPQKSPSYFSTRHISISASGYKYSFCSFLLCFFIPFFFPSTLVTHHKRLGVYRTTINDEHRVTLTLSPSCPPHSYMANFYIHHHYFFFLSRFNRTATVIGPLAEGLDGHVVRLGIRL